MSEEILINATPTETRVAVIESGMVQEVHIERRSQYSSVGNVYLGKVSRVLPGMQAAFVDIGLERTAFLHASDIAREDVETEVDVSIESSAQSATQAGTHAGPPSSSDETPAEQKITELLRQGQEILVQVIKDPIGNKGARLTTQISIPSRFLVLLPDARNIGVSLRIEDETERERLRSMMNDLLDHSDPNPFGFILRTNAEGINGQALADDITYLRKVWESIQQRISTAKPGDCVYEDLSLPLRALRDFMHAGVEKVRIDDISIYEHVGQFARQFMAGWLDRLEYYRGHRPIFDLNAVDDEIENALKPNTGLKSGGYLITEQTEAMSTIDVNTGGFVGYRNLEETVYKTNLEATQAIARQLRLRNLSGIIIIDFIDMQDEHHQEQVLLTLERALENDHARTSISGFSNLGLVEMTRKRTTDSLANRLCEPCPTCSGRGLIKSVETVCSEILREIVRAVQQFDAEELRVLAATSVVDRMREEHSSTIAEMEESLGKYIRFQSDAQYPQEQFDVVLL